MKKVLGTLIAVTFVLVAVAAVAESQPTQTATPMAKPVEAAKVIPAASAPTAVKPVEAAKIAPTSAANAPVATKPVESAKSATAETTKTLATTTKEPKVEAEDICKKKGVAGAALEECVKNELAKVKIIPEMAKPAEALKVLETPKAPAAATATATKPTVTPKAVAPTQGTTPGK